jgi:hypothetical protein
VDTFIGTIFPRTFLQVLFSGYFLWVHSLGTGVRKHVMLPIEDLAGVPLAIGDADEDE